MTTMSIRDVRLSHLVLLDSGGDSWWEQENAPELLAKRGFSPTKPWTHGSGRGYSVSVLSATSMRSSSDSSEMPGGVFVGVGSRGQMSFFRTIRGDSNSISSPCSERPSRRQGRS